MNTNLGITVDFRAGVVCPTIAGHAAGEEVVFFPAERLVRMSNCEFRALARQRRQTPQGLLREVLKAAVIAAQQVMEQEPGDVKEKVCRLLLQGEVVSGRDKELIFLMLV